MSIIEENGITHNSFYETKEELGFEPMTEEELSEYKNLVGMPTGKTYEELISSLKTNNDNGKDKAILTTKKYYIAVELEESYENVKIYESEEFALLFKAIELMQKEHGIKPSYGFLTDDDTKETEYTLIERYYDQFKNLNKTVYLSCIDSTNIKTSHVLKFKEIENLYEYLLSNNKFKLVYNNEYEMKHWLNVPLFNTDIIQKYFLDNLQVSKEVRNKNIKKLKTLFPDSIELIKKLETFIFRISKEEAEKFLTEELKENNYDLYDNIRIKQKQHGNLIRRLVLKIK